MEVDLSFGELEGGGESEFVVQIQAGLVDAFTNYQAQ